MVYFGTLICPFSKVEKFKFSQILLGDKNTTSLCSKNISTLLLLYHYLFGDTQGPNMLRHVVALRKQRTALTFHLITTLVALNEVNKELENTLLNSRAG